MDIFQSTAFTLARVNLSLYEQRIIIKIVESAQGDIEGLHLGEHKYKLPHSCDNVEVIIPIRYILNSKSHNYDIVRQSAQHLCSLTWTVYDSEKVGWVTGSVLSQVQYVKGSGDLRVYVNKFFYDCLYDFARGYKRYELEQSLSINSPTAIRMYQIMYNQTSPITYTIDYLKKTFGCADKYKQTADFIKKVIDPAQKELQRARVHNFTYHREKDGQKVVALTFFPVKIHKQEDSFFSSMTSEVMAVYKSVMVILHKDCGFTSKELDCHVNTLKSFAQVPGVIDRLLSIVHRARKKDNIKPYVIASIKAEVKQFNDCPAPIKRKTRI